MRPRFATLICVLCAGTLLTAQSPTPKPQTARQALIEMFLGEGDGFAKHLPEAAQKLYSQNSDAPFLTTLLRSSGWVRQLESPAERRQIFDDGPAILINEFNEGRDKTEVTVERDSQAGETEEIELSVHLYHDGQEQWLAVEPRLSFTMKQEKGIWRLVDVAANLRVPLSDPLYLRGLRQQQQEATESTVQWRIVTLLKAERGYHSDHPDRGYACQLSTLLAPEPADARSDDSDNVPQGYFDPGQGNTEWNGYRFAVQGCDGSPATKFQLTAVPVDSSSGMKTFCGDESGTVKATAVPKIAECFANGDMVSSPEEEATTDASE